MKNYYWIHDLDCPSTPPTPFQNLEWKLLAIIFEQQKTPIHIITSLERSVTSSFLHFISFHFFISVLFGEVTRFLEETFFPVKQAIEQTVCFSKFEDVRWFLRTFVSNFCLKMHSPKFVPKVNNWMFADWEKNFRPNIFQDSNEWNRQVNSRFKASCWDSRHQQCSSRISSHFCVLKSLAKTSRKYKNMVGGGLLLVFALALTRCFHSSNESFLMTLTHHTARSLCPNTTTPPPPSTGALRWFVRFPNR